MLLVLNMAGIYLIMIDYSISNYST